MNENRNEELEKLENPYRRMLDGWGRNKWVKGQFVTHDRRRVCLSQRANDCIADQRWLVDTITELYPDVEFVSIATFNDRPKTRWVDIEKIVEKTAVKWDEMYG